PVGALGRRRCVGRDRHPTLDGRFEIKKAESGEVDSASRREGGETLHPEYRRPQCQNVTHPSSRVTNVRRTDVPFAYNERDEENGRGAPAGGRSRLYCP